jgi:hypothetical protein
MGVIESSTASIPQALPCNGQQRGGYSGCYADCHSKLDRQFTIDGSFAKLLDVNFHESFIPRHSKS